MTSQELDCSVKCMITGATKSNSEIDSILINDIHSSHTNFNLCYYQKAAFISMENIWFPPGFIRMVFSINYYNIL
jgi:hypothetical protein